MVQNHTQGHDFNQTNSSDAPMASSNNKQEHGLKVAAEVGLFVALASMVLVHIFIYFNLFNLCFSDTKTVIEKETSLGNYMLALMNLLCPFLKLIIQRVSMSNVIPLIQLFSFLVIIWAVAVLLLLGPKFSRIHSVMFFIWSILLMLQGSGTLTVGIYLIILGLLFIWSSRRKQQANNQMKGKSCSQTWNPIVALRCIRELCIRDSNAKYTSTLCL
ncbi:uncharacterized protein LOC107485953 isoform X2 [Arachis duranensis]|uniref:Uncharacterized protein LOC107485953 isoform X2 n=1 Tax=Arachis duranensis TaxID=130453 RepID=A0A6P4D693_ARADU|nr:uncharacterized protein LOC107485953 isoform X2 [Arachis duranensis]